MGHISHKGTLPETRLVGAFCFLLQTFLFLYEIGDIAHDTIGSHHLAVLVEERHTLDEVPLQFLVLMEEGTHVGQVCTLHTEIGLIFPQTLFERTVHKVVDELVEVKTQFRAAHAFIECTDAVLVIDSEETHVTVLHQILQLVLVALDSLVLLSYTCFVAFVLEIELTFLSNVSNREGDEEEFALFVIDRVEAHLCVAVHASLDDHTLRTEIEFLCLSVIEHFPERRHVVDGIAVIIGIILCLEIQDFAHFPISSQQFSIFVIESQSHQALVEDLAIAVSHLLFLLLSEDTFCFICQRTEEVGWYLQGRIGIFCDTDIAHPVPLALVLLGTPVPAEEALCGLVALDESFEGLCIEVTVIWMDIFETLIVAHAFLWQEVTMHIAAIALLHREFQHVVVAGVEGVLHDGREILHLHRVLADTQEGDTIHHPSNDKGNEHDDDGHQ